MKQLASFLMAAIAMLSINLTAANASASTSTETYCVWDSWFEYPKKEQKFNKGKHVYVRVKPKQHQHIAHMELYVDGKFVRAEKQYPYEWGRPNSGGDHHLRNLGEGKHKILVKIKDKCGRYHEKYCYIYVVGHHPPPDYCHYNNPLYDLHWLKSLHHKYPGYSICEYKKGKKSYFKIFKCGQSHYTEYWYDCSGKLLCKFNNGYSHPLVKDAHLVKCWYEGCGGGHPPVCEWDSWFKFPKDRETYEAGKDLYVRVDPKKYQHIQHMELYLNGKFIRTEKQFPYEWGRPNSGGDHYLRNLKPGEYKLLVKIKDKCGKYHEKYCYFYVKHHNCHFNDPIYDLPWLKQIRYKYPAYSICEYKKDGKTFFKIFKCGQSHYTEYWYNCSGKLLCKFNNGYNHPLVQGAHKIKDWYSGCGGGFPGG